ncbi:MAG: hypothetical protein MJY67_02080 [Bacteroidales bacterium]|nr:hypothetical protein [Bacteroidales bacterium]
MRRILIIIEVVLFTALSAYGQRSIHERVLLTTDRNCYVAGEQIWYSAFCLDAADYSRPSSFSAIAYVELISTQGGCVCSKADLRNGRGCGALTIPNETASGNYLLIAYTALEKEEGTELILNAGKPVTIYNTLTNQRIEGGYQISPGMLSTLTRQEPSPSETLSIICEELLMKNTPCPVSLSGQGFDNASLSVSISHIDSLEQFPHKSLGEIINSEAFKSYKRQDHFLPEYDGEIIRARIKGEIPPEAIGTPVFISSTGHDSNIYSSSIDSQGQATFFTGNIFGEDDLVFQAVGWDPEKDFSVEIQSPFLTPTLEQGALDKIIIDETMSEQLRQRSVAMQIGTRFTSDTLFTRIPPRMNLLFNKGRTERYNLDDFVRYPSMSELVVEILKPIKLSKEDGQEVLSIRLKDDISYNHDNIVFSAGALIMLDGVPVLDHKKFLEYDPMLLQAVEVYPYSIVTGERIFGGCANFITKKGNLSGVDFDKRTKVLSFKGVDFPKKFTPSAIGENFPDYRQTLYWDPIVELSKGQTRADLLFVTPSYQGKFRIRVEGFDENGEYIFAEKDITVR